MHSWTNLHLDLSYHPCSPRDFTQSIERYTYFYYGNFEIDLQTTQRVCNVLIIVNVYLYLLNLQEMWVGQVVHKSKWSF